ncbi:hypothetical protein BKA82DRAFT_4115020 [Pisolithus tinctorius]|nr:hypothetical protein BKA82DRAFT_4115020 [Pisolithus tinctorius]
MHPLQAVVFLLSSGCFARARLLYSGPEDLYAFPKSRVTFLNNFPVSNETARRWLREGLKGGEREFMGDFLDTGVWHPPALVREIGGSELESFQPLPQDSQLGTSNYTLERMKMGPDSDFLCLIPPPRDSSPAPEELDRNEAIRNGWSLLQPLTGKCLYHRQTWFTYSYCHNREIRQFKELPPNHPHAQGSYEPAEDPEWEAFTLGRAPTTSEAGADIVVADQFPRTANLEVGHGPGTRYLVQRWGDGTFCDKTGKPREVEVQFHCSMTMTDSILFVREAKTCSYVLVVQTPRLCGEPGFKSRLQNRDELLIRCRQIIDLSTAPAAPAEQLTQLEERQSDNVGESDFPHSLSNRQSLFPIPSPSSTQGSIGLDPNAKDDPFDGILRRTMEALMKNPEIQALTGSNQQVYLNRGEDGEIIIEILEEIPMDGSGAGATRNEMSPEAYSQLTDALRKAGFDVRDDMEVNSEGGEMHDEEDEEQSHNLRDEL